MAAARVIMPQFWDRPAIPKVWAMMDGKTPNNMPYARPVTEETTMRWWGSEIWVPANWPMQNRIADANRHQKRDRLKFLTRKSDPMPLWVVS